MWNNMKPQSFCFWEGAAAADEMMNVPVREFWS
jgi:hypothetical protein